MIPKDFLDGLASKLGETIDNSPIKDVEKNVKSILGSALNKMDLVTREEFEIQKQILLKTREKLTELEAKIAQLQNQQSTEPHSDNLDNSI